MTTLLKLLLIISAVLTIATFSGCSLCEKKVYIDKPVPYAVPVACHTPDVDCTFSGSDSEVVVGMLKCIVDLKRSNEVCK